MLNPKKMLEADFGHYLGTEWIEAQHQKTTLPSHIK
jgi:hypothetical protein